MTSTRDTLPSQGPNDIARLPFEKALSELETIVSRLEQGNVDLEESISIYERGEALKKRCDTLLKKAEMRIEKMTKSADGEMSAEPFEEKNSGDT